MKFKMFDVVQLMSDITDLSVNRGTFGVIVEELENGYLIDFTTEKDFISR